MNRINTSQRGDPSPLATTTTGPMTYSFKIYSFAQLFAQAQGLRSGLQVLSGLGHVWPHAGVKVLQNNLDYLLNV